ncbi:Helix-turn-helix domain-containing protein [Pseudobutyrivibrio sp. ACV-2]|uniref:helix-turn-helix domain-containing protein n=1 Tax=Pseudobutyrivibrio sp. ACV-2 TaxID=1520801 RepID=UPI0008993A9D|nr:helix-turn-helix transcriptional regulator [Pseudobutyrivibrio sp. ACV-2]SDZ90816.1 Helix-turn-helix domain-containing protein [Pseudobutyrivibrio sp. ACV-2]
MYPIIDKIKTGEKIRMLMEANGYSVNDIQEYLGLACVQSIYHWLNGSCLPSIDNLYALSDLLNVSIDDMICGNKLEKIDQNIPDRVLHYYDKLKDIIAA